MRDPTSFGRPSAIAIPKTSDEVLAVVKFCKATGCKISVACGRHTPSSIKQGVMMIDMTSQMNSVVVDSESKTITVGGGAKIGAVDAACKPHNFILPLGRVGSTGCAGQMLYTGAHGYCERALGLGVDYMTSATVVLTTGVLHCSETENSDLFWGIRGGQSNFGIVSEMVFRAQEAPNKGQFMASQKVYLPVGMLGFASRQGVMDYIVQKMDTASPEEYNISATFIGAFLLMFLQSIY
jgi:FAD/FMN-containing dehydrogenase